MSNQDLYKQIPSVDEIIKNLSSKLLSLPRNLLKKVIRDSIKEIKVGITSNKIKQVKDNVYLLVNNKLNKINKPHLHNVINGTGIVLHTGLGRSPISKDIFNKALDSTYPYTNLEFSLSEGERGERNNGL